MKFEHLIAAAPESPSFDDEWALLDDVFEGLRAGNSTAFYDLAYEQFPGEITTKKIEHAQGEITPLLLDRRIVTSCQQLVALGAGQSLLAAQRNYVLRSPSLKRMPVVRQKAVEDLYIAEKALLNYSMNQYSQGLMFFRELAALGHETTRQKKKALFDARSFWIEDVDPSEFIPRMDLVRFDLQKHYHEARSFDLEYAQFKTACVAAHFSLGLSDYQKTDQQYKLDQAYQLFMSTAHPQALGIAEIDAARHVWTTLTPATRLDQNYSPRI